MDVQIRERALLERELRLAVGRGDIEPHYQPVFDLRTGAITRFEALARWDHATLGDIPPDRFIPLAEDCGLIRELSRQLLTTACRDARHWPGHTTLSFNVSPVQLRDSTFGLHALAILGETGFPPHRLEIEITEAALVRDLKAAKDSLESLRNAGVRNALDDFDWLFEPLSSAQFRSPDQDRSQFAAAWAGCRSAAIVRALISGRARRDHRGGRGNRGAT